MSTPTNQPDQLVTAQEIAERLGVSIWSIRKWQYTKIDQPLIRRAVSFPEPVLKGQAKNSTPYWRWGDVLEWAEKRPSISSAGASAG